jgi:hypothetical protein
MNAETVTETATAEVVVAPPVALPFTAEHDAMLRDIHGFCATLANMLDAMSENPMLAAMMPPGVFPTKE